jgi:hypothetical protein
MGFVLECVDGDVDMFRYGPSLTCPSRYETHDQTFVRSALVASAKAMHGRYATRYWFGW